jgi:hypothetical protein
MSSIWKLNGADFYVDADKEGISPHIVEHNPINSTNSYYHKVYVPDDEISLGGHVVGKTHLNTIRDGVGEIVELITDTGGIAPSGTNIMFLKFDYDRLDQCNQTIDTQQAGDAPVYKVTVVLRR